MSCENKVALVKGHSKLTQLFFAQFPESVALCINILLFL